MNPQSITQPDPEAKGELGPAMKGADVLVNALEREGVDVVFAYPGGASMELHQSLTKSEKIRTILPRQEQGGGFMAHGFARATGKAGVCMATSGPGATNLVTCIADAYMDSIPLVAITGQVYQQFIGKSAFQETDFFGMTLPIVKHSYLVLTAEADSPITHDGPDPKKLDLKLTTENFVVTADLGVKLVGMFAKDDAVIEMCRN